MVAEQFPTPPLHLNAGAQNLVTLRPKKRKRSTNHSWIKEVSGGSKNLQDIYTAPLEWTRATNRLMEKIEVDEEVIEDMLRPKRRIILATQLMQQASNYFPLQQAVFSQKMSLQAMRVWHFTLLDWRLEMHAILYALITDQISSLMKVENG